MGRGWEALPRKRIKAPLREEKREAASYLELIYQITKPLTSSILSFMLFLLVIGSAPQQDTLRTAFLGAEARLQAQFST
jgi:hypothetical protein